VSVNVTNTGDVAGDEVIQVYVRDVVGSTTRPDRALKAFQRVHVAPGETRRVQLTLEAGAFEMIDRTFQRVIEPGAFSVLVGTSSRLEDLRELKLVIEA
jgi:beta-glucosidase